MAVDKAKHLVGHRYQKGNVKKGGRAAGTPNRYTAQIKDMVEQALHKAGGVDYLVRQAEANPKSFLPLVAKLLPSQPVVAINVLGGEDMLDRLQLGRQRAMEIIESVDYEEVEDGDE